MTVEVLPETIYLTPDIRAMIGATSPRVEAGDPVESSEVRRFVQATMDPNPRYRPGNADTAPRFGGAVAPPGFPVHTFRHRLDGPDVLDAMADPNFDGLRRDLRPGLPTIESPLKRLLNGGYEYELFRLARIGDRIFRESTYLDIEEKSGRSGPMLIIRIRDLYTNQDEEPLLSVLATTILR